MSDGEMMPTSTPLESTRARPSAHSLSRGSKSAAGSSGRACASCSMGQAMSRSRVVARSCGSTCRIWLKVTKPTGPRPFSVTGNVECRCRIRSLLSKSATVINPDAVIGFGVITSRMASWPSWLRTVACWLSAVAAPIKNQPISANHRPPKSARVKKMIRPRATRIQPKTSPARLDHWIALSRSPVRHQMIERSSRPPSKEAAPRTAEAGGWVGG